MSELLVSKIENHKWDWLAASMLIFLLQIAAARLVATLWTIDLNLVMVITFIGTILGLVFGKSTFRRFWVIILSFAYGVILIPWQLGLTLDNEMSWQSRILILWGKLEIVIQELLSRRSVTDNLLFLLLMALLFWALSIYSGFVLVREANPWKVVLPGGITTFVIHSFDPFLISRSWYLAVYLFIALLLVTRLVYRQNIQKWSERHTHTPPDIGFDISRVAFIMSILLVFFAWNVPVLADTFTPVANIWQTTTHPWVSIKNRFSFIFASLQASVAHVQNYYGNTLPLGLGSQLTDQIVMEVLAPTNPPSGNRFYWEARAYDTYENDQWLTSLQTTYNLTSESADLHQPGIDVRSVITFTFFPQNNISNLYAVPEPLWTSLPSQSDMQINSDGSVDFRSLSSRGYIRQGEQYQVRSAIDTFTISQLRGAGTSYPDWVRNEYLQLPDDITPRTRQLAQNIASGLNNPYDIAAAVTEYLRNNIKYSQSISAPPKNHERIDWFLFDYRKGFCNYYATAEVILLRSLGIPARMAVGFAQGQSTVPTVQQLPGGVGQDIIQLHMSETSLYVVRDKDAHAWPEVFFPGFGWVIFEPTVSQSPLSRPSGDSGASYSQIESGRGRDNTVNHQELGSERQLPDSNGITHSAGNKIGFWTTTNIILLILFQLAVGVAIILFWQALRGFSIKKFFEKNSVVVAEKFEQGLLRVGFRAPDWLVNWIYFMKLPALSRSYMEINRALERLNTKPATQDTPSQRTLTLISAVPAMREPAQQLLAEYEISIYSPHQADSELARKAGIEVRKLSRRVRLLRILSRFMAPLNIQIKL